ncbi:putative F420-dependent oxidoreductase [Constrictibacter sp. MBR-5]|jgi:probable F420-dependent oxidoreductase|uniref:TIGR03617 family F420-dependent LLM class oxidoreductase n=1 Tax=Constrictibacter sp. MBR-5 TaxID=3156467 RepID=UPI0033995E80
MRISTGLPQGDLRKTVEAAKRIEAAGYDAVATQENRHDPFLPLAAAAVSTERLGLATSVAIAFPRSPMVVANACWDLQETSRGRFTLGLGSQVKGHNERRFGIPWSPPAPRMKEYVEALRAIWTCWRTGGELNYQGEHYRFSLMTPGFVPPGSGQPPIPVTIAAVNPAMLRVAGHVCDGVRLHPFCTRRYAEEVVMPQIAEGMRRGSRERKNFEVSGGGYIVTGPDEASLRAGIEFVRYRIAFYGSTRLYWPVLELHGFHDLCRTLNRMVAAGQWDRIAAEVPDEAVELFAAIGTYDGIVSAIEKRFGGICDVVSSNVPDETPMPPGLLQDVRRIATPFEGFAAG